MPRRTLQQVLMGTSIRSTQSSAEAVWLVKMYLFLQYAWHWAKRWPSHEWVHVLQRPFSVCACYALALAVHNSISPRDFLLTFLEIVNNVLSYVNYHTKNASKITDVRGRYHSRYRTVTLNKEFTLCWHSSFNVLEIYIFLKPVLQDVLLCNAPYLLGEGEECCNAKYGDAFRECRRVGRMLEANRSVIETPIIQIIKGLLETSSLRAYSKQTVRSCTTLL